jgi:hypothetical protein
MHDHPSVPHQHHSHPQWLMTQFHQFILECKKRDNKKWPPVYQSGSFWFPTRSPFFILKDKQLQPQSLFPQRWFYWDPECLLPHDVRLKCTCGHSLIHKSHSTQPCHVIDFGDCFWMIGYHYQCWRCPDAGAKTKTFTSWHPHILQQLPYHLASEFPAYLSHRSAISKTCFQFMRSCFHSGMGSKQFADSLRVNCLQCYDEWHLMYLQGIYARSKEVHHQLI